MTNLFQPLLQLPEEVCRDVQGYRAKVERFLRGETTPLAFKAYRVPMGIYEQRTDGQYMARIRIGAGTVSPGQLGAIAGLSRKYGNGILYVTTRQDIQIHALAIEDTPAVLEELLAVGLSSRGGGGNTVRNVSACPRAGVCPEEVFDVRPCAVAVSEYLLQFKSSYNLPRKYKIAFSGCKQDCAFAAVTDLGFIAQLKAGRKGFRVYGGGGLGGNPRIGVLLDEWIEAGEILMAAEAIKRVFDQHGDRSNKRAARLRYVLNRFGEEKFRGLYRQALTEVKAEGLPGRVPEIKVLANPGYDKDSTELFISTKEKFPPGVLPENRPGYYSIRLNLDRGDIRSDAALQIAELASTYAEGFVRTSQQQNILLCRVQEGKVPELLNQLEKIKPGILGLHRPGIIACAGASTCKLGLCLSRGLASAITEKFGREKINADGPNNLIRISGCPNSCGNHHIAPLGLEGKARRVNGRLMPYYDLLLGGHAGENAALGERIASIPARAVPSMIAEIYNRDLSDLVGLQLITDKYAELPEEIPEDYYRDWGASEPFSLAGRGPGECSVGVMDIIRVDLDEARQKLTESASATTAQEFSQKLYHSLLAGARALLPIFGLEPKTDRAVLQNFTERLVIPGWVDPHTRELIDAALDWRLGERDSLREFTFCLENLNTRLEALFLSLDANLNFRLPPLTGNNSRRGMPPSHLSDLRGVACPMNFVKAKVALEQLPVGEVLEILLDDGEPVKNVPASFIEQGQEVLSIAGEKDYFRIKVQRIK